MILNDGQEYVVKEAIKWFNYSSDMLFQLEGYAGTGKSTVIAEIINRLGLRPDEVLPMAYTGQAAIVMRTKGLHNACTCHSALFTPKEVPATDPVTGKIIMDPEFNTPIIKWTYEPKNFSASHIRLIIVDEAWTVPEYFRQYIENTHIKVLAAGDSAQLPPIASKPAYLVDGKIYKLTQLMRQSEDSPLVYIANRARNGFPIDCGMYGNDVLVLFDTELDNSIISRSDIVLCCHNKTRDKLNDIIRKERYGFSTDYPRFGERIICRKNNWSKEVDGISLVNGLTGTVTSHVDPSCLDKDNIILDFTPDLLNKPFSRLPISYKYLNSDYSRKEMLKSSPYIFGERFEYAYSSTVHLAQGSEYYSGIFFEEYMGDMQRNLNYTAITRFRNKMIYVKHAPKYW